MNINAINTKTRVTTVDIARHLVVVKDTVYHWCEHKGLPAHRIGRLWEFQFSEVDEWVCPSGAEDEADNVLHIVDSWVIESGRYAGTDLMNQRVISAKGDGGWTMAMPLVLGRRLGEGDI